MSLKEQELDRQIEKSITNFFTSKMSKQKKKPNASTGKKSKKTTKSKPKNSIKESTGFFAQSGGIMSSKSPRFEKVPKTPGPSDYNIWPPKNRESSPSARISPRKRNDPNYRSLKFP